MRVKLIGDHDSPKHGELPLLVVNLLRYVRHQAKRALECFAETEGVAVLAQRYLLTLLEEETVYDRQMWKCLQCSRERIYGNTPTPDYGQTPVPVEHARRAYLLCEGPCNKGKLRKTHTPHIFTRTLFPAIAVEIN